MNQSAPNSDFRWQTSPAGQRVVNRVIDSFLAESPMATQLADRMQRQTGTRFRDWVDHVVVPQSSDLVSDLVKAGFSDEQNAGDTIYRHQGAVFPAFVLRDVESCQLVIKVESVADFLATHGLPCKVEGTVFGQLRWACISRDARARLWIVERHGCSAMNTIKTDRDRALASQEHFELFRRRRRQFDGEEAAFDYLDQLLDPAISALGKAWAADIWFTAERDYWMRRNRVARIQKARQDSLGLGWANHDHHTYRCRRQTFSRVVAFFEKLGCRCRERFHAGDEAGWGAQVLEHVDAGIVIFADVDMSPDELTSDFAHEGFSPRDDLGTVGLWCELHGESLFEAGMHHLECQFDFDRLQEQLLREHGIRMLEPFTNFAHLKQQFSEGETWPVEPSRIEKLLREEQIDEQQAESFRQDGAVGSHLENLERNDGFKGFNQAGVSDIIRRTDPRKMRRSAP